MRLYENDLAGANVNEVLATLEDLGIEITYTDYDEGEVMYIETSVNYSIDFCNGVCCWSGYEEETED